MIKRRARSRKILSGIALLAAVMATSIAPLWAAGEEADADFKQLDTLFEKARLDLKAPALVYGIVANGSLVHEGGFGLRQLGTNSLADQHTAFRIASMTKMMTALLVLDLQDQGKLYLDAPAETYVKALASLSYPTTDSRRITVRDLLNHTAGFVTDDPWADRQMARSNAELDVFLSEAQPFSSAPGERFEYSNLGYIILGRIIENTSGQSFSEQLEARILAPLEMTGTTLDLHAVPSAHRAGAYNWVDGSFQDEPVLESGAFDPLGGIWTTVEDYGKFVAWFLSAWPARSEPDNSAIPRRVVRSVTDGVFLLGMRKGSGLNRGDDCSMATAYSMGLSVKLHCDGGLILSHGGGFPGFGSYLMMMPDKGLGVFAFSNETYAAVYGPVWDAARVLIDSDLGRSPSRKTPEPELQSAYEGIFKAYSTADIHAGELSFADNFFLDRSEQRWSRQLKKLLAEAGQCVASPLEPQGRLSGRFQWQCDSARIAGNLLLSPVNSDEVQKLHMRVLRRSASGGNLVTDFDFH